MTLPLEDCLTGLTSSSTHLNLPHGGVLGVVAEKVLGETPGFLDHVHVVEKVDLLLVGGFHGVFLVVHHVVSLKSVLQTFRFYLGLLFESCPQNGFQNSGCFQYETPNNNEFVRLLEMASFFI